MEDTQTRQVLITLDINETVEIKSATSKRVVPNYYRVGNGTMNKYQVKSIDLIDVVIASSKAGQFLIQKIKAGMNWDNSYHFVTKINSSLLTSTEKQYLAIGYKELEAIDIVRRVKRGHYMLNPNALISIQYDEAIALWNSIPKRTEQEQI